MIPLALEFKESSNISQSLILPFISLTALKRGECCLGETQVRVDKDMGCEQGFLGLNESFHFLSFSIRMARVKDLRPLALQRYGKVPRHSGMRESSGQILFPT